EEHRRAGDVIGLSDAAQRSCRFGASEGLSVLPQRASEIGAHKPRSNAIHSNVLWPPLDCEIPRELKVSGFRDCVDSKIERTLQTSDAGNNNHAAVAAFSHVGNRQIAKPDVASDI